MRDKYLLRLLLQFFIVGLYSLFFYQVGYAQGPTPTPPIQEPAGNTDPSTLPGSTPSLTSTTILTDSTTALPVTPSTPPASSEPGAPQARTLSLAELGYEDVTITGLYGEAAFDLYLPSYWEILPGSSFTLHYLPEAGLAGPVEGFELQVRFDGETIHRAVVNSFEEQFLNISLPAIQPEYRKGHQLKISLRSLGDCGDNFSLFRIFSDSFFSLNYRASHPILDLVYYPSPISERTFFTQTAYLILPDQPAQLPLEGVLSLVARLGQLAKNNLSLTTTAASALDPANLPDEHLIIVGTPESNELLSALNEASLLPASFRQRRLQLAGAGPDLILPDTLLTYTLHLSNNEAATASNLGLEVQLPASAQRVSCQPECQRVDNMIHWDIGSLQPDEAAAVTLSMAYPFTTSAPIDLSFELAQNQEIINVTTLHTPLEPEADPGADQTASASPFFFVVGDRAVPETDGIIQLLPSPQRLDKAILLVTGLTDEAVYKAGRALGTQPGLLGMTGQVALIQDVFEGEDLSLELPESFTFADLGYEDRVIVGPTSQTVLYRFNLPLNWQLTREAEVRLDFSHSSLLDPTGSSITLHFNSTPVASVALDETNSITGELRALLPRDKIRVGRPNNLLVGIELHVKDSCLATVSQSWINLKASSSVHLPHRLSDGPAWFDLDFLPSPFSVNADLHDVIFALPEYPSTLEYDAAVQLALYLGATSAATHFQPGLLLGDPAGVDLSASHVIIIGRPSRNLLLQEVNESLPQPFIPGTDTIRPQVNKVVLRLPDHLDLGYLQLIASRWSQTHALLAVTGTSDLGLAWAARAVTEPEKNERLKGNLVLAPNDLELHTADTRGLPTAGKVAALAAAVPETVMVGTATPTPLPPNPTPEPQVARTQASSPSAAIPNPPEWVPYVVGGGIALILIILVVAYWQSRRRARLGV